jgi:hypothetical protein
LPIPTENAEQLELYLYPCYTSQESNFAVTTGSETERFLISIYGKNLKPHDRILITRRFVDQ